MKSTVLLSVLLFAAPASAATDPLAELASRFCVKCHGQHEPQGDVRLDRLPGSVFQQADRLETLIAVLAEEQMPPAEEKQPTERLRAEAIAHLKSALRDLSRPTRLKRLTREEYGNTINDLFGVQFDLTDLLPPDAPVEGFNKWGDSQMMSPHQVESYLKTARFVADRLVLDERPERRQWEFGLEHFNGSGRGDFKTDTAFVLSTHYPWRSNLHFYLTEKQEEIFRIPTFGVYRFEADVTVRNSKKTQTISVSTGDPRYPTNFKKIARIILPADGESITVDLTLTAGTYVSFTYESAATWNVGNNPRKYKGPQVAFSRVRIRGPLTEEWPTRADRRLFAEGQFSALAAEDVREFTEHLISLLLNRSLPSDDVRAFEELATQKLETTHSPRATARILLTALLSSPHFIYKHETDELDGVALAHRLSYFLWNSVPDAELLERARAGQLTSRAALFEQVERMLADPRSDRFCEDFTRQWLQTDKIDDIGPDDRVHDKKHVTFMRIRELAKEPRAFFREILHRDLSMVNFIDSDFAMVNDETADLYGFPAVQGREFRSVSVPADSERGGLIGQAGLLKLTSGKFTTSPILRGAWILKSLYGQKLDPPPNLTFDQPDVRGAETIREVIEKHKSTTTCNRCHARIDPLGLALEHYDEMGLWRDEYRHVEVSSLENQLHSVKLRMAPIDSTARLSDGRQISSLTELKAVLMDDRDKVLQGILAKLTSYALGREIGVWEQDVIDEIYQKVASQDHSLRAAIHAIVQHESFELR